MCRRSSRSKRAPRRCSTADRPASGSWRPGRRGPCSPSPPGLRHSASPPAPLQVRGAPREGLCPSSPVTHSQAHSHTQMILIYRSTCITHSIQPHSLMLTDVHSLSDTHTLDSHRCLLTLIHTLIRQCTQTHTTQTLEDTRHMHLLTPIHSHPHSYSHSRPFRHTGSPTDTFTLSLRYTDTLSKLSLRHTSTPHSHTLTFPHGMSVSEVEYGSAPSRPPAHLPGSWKCHVLPSEMGFLTLEPLLEAPQNIFRSTPCL